MASIGVDNLYGHLVMVLILMNSYGQAKCGNNYITITKHDSLFHQAYRKAFIGQVGRGPNGVKEAEIYYGPHSTGTPTSTHSLAFIQPSHKNNATYVQRWKVLRDRNKNLPKLDFNAKASGIPKKFQAAGSFSRSYTYDSMKLPSISTASVVTGVTVQSDGYRRKDNRDKRSIQEQQSDLYTDLTHPREVDVLNATLSKSLQSLTEEKQRHEEEESASSRRFERISYQKHLSKRRANKEVTVTLPKEPTVIFQREHLSKDTESVIGKQFVLVKDHRKEREKQTRPDISVTNKKLPVVNKAKNVVKSELQLLEQSGIYQIDLSSVRNEIPPVSHALHPPINSAQTERSYRSRRQQKSSKRRSATSKPSVLDKKWRDGCDCLRCDIMRRQFSEGDLDSYKNWGNYPFHYPYTAESRVRKNSSPFDVTNNSDTDTITPHDDAMTSPITPMIPPDALSQSHLGAE